MRTKRETNVYSGRCPMSENRATTKCPRCSQVNFAVEPECRSCGEPLNAWQQLSPELQKRYQYRHCGGQYKLIATRPNEGTGCIIMILGLLFAPIIIGIPILIYGFRMKNKTHSYWQCGDCGMTLPRLKTL